MLPKEKHRKSLLDQKYFLEQFTLFVISHLYAAISNNTIVKISDSIVVYNKLLNITKHLIVKFDQTCSKLIFLAKNACNIHLLVSITVAL